MKPDALDRVDSLADRHLKHGTGACAQQHRAAHLSNNAGHLSGGELVHGARVQPVLITEGKMVEQVLDGLDVAGRQISGDALPNAFDEFDRSGKLQHRAMLSSRGLSILGGLQRYDPPRIFRVTRWRSVA